MRLNYSIEACAEIFEAEVIGSSIDSILHVYFDSRKIHSQKEHFFLLYPVIQDLEMNLLTTPINKESVFL